MSAPPLHVNTVTQHFLSVHSYTLTPRLDWKHQDFDTHTRARTHIKHTQVIVLDVQRRLFVIALGLGSLSPSPHRPNLWPSCNYTDRFYSTFGLWLRQEVRFSISKDRWRLDLPLNLVRGRSMNGARGQHSYSLQRANWPGALLVFGCVLFFFFVFVSERQKLCSEYTCICLPTFVFMLQTRHVKH